MPKPPEEPEVFTILRKIRYDATAIQAKVTEALRALSAMNLPAKSEGVRCSFCGTKVKGDRALAFHLQNVHDGPAVPLTAEEEATP